MAGDQERVVAPPTDDRIAPDDHARPRAPGWVSGVIYGANDGLAAVFGIVTGVAGATGGSSLVLTAGLAGAMASALSMATGAYLAERSETEVAQANLAQKRREIAQNPAREKAHLSSFYQAKGLDKADADALVEKLAKDPEGMLELVASVELGIGHQDARNPAQAALAAGISTALGAIIPVIPFFWLNGTSALLAAAAVSLVAHFLVGAAKSLVTLRTWWAAGLEMTLAGIIVGTVTYAAGLLFQGR
jgi:vacuolar iron transporter family protein